MLDASPSGKGMPLVSSEWGYSSLYPTPSMKANDGGMPSRTGCDEELQAKFLPRMWLTNMLADVRLSIWYELLDGASATDSEAHFGLLRAPGGGELPSPKQGFRAARTFTRMLRGRVLRDFCGPHASVMEGWPAQAEALHCKELSVTAPANITFVMSFGLSSDAASDGSRVMAVWTTDVTQLPAAVTIRPAASEKPWSNTTCFDVTSYTGDVLDGVCANSSGVVNMFADNAPAYLALRTKTAALKTDDEVFLLTPDLVDTTTMTRRVGRLQKDEAPVIVAEHPWEHSFFFYHSLIQPLGAGVGEVWMYYSTETVHGCFICLARSQDDGRTFEKPMNLGAVEFAGSSANNIVLQLSKPNPLANASVPAGLQTFANVFVDDRPGVPVSERYKLTAAAKGDMALQLFGSESGVRWKLLSTGGSNQMGLWSDVADTQPITFWDKHANRYQTYGRFEPQRRKCQRGLWASRMVGYSAAEVGGSLFSKWSNPTTALGFPESGPCTDTYNSAAVQRGNAYVSACSCLLWLSS